MNKSKGNKTNNRRGTKGGATPTTTTIENGGSEKKKPQSKKNKTSGKNAKKIIPVEEKPKILPELPEGKKLERSNSFISRGLSKLYNTLTGSRDGINKTSSGESLESHDKVPEPPTFLRRSRTLGTISLRKHRRSIPTPLEELAEETDQQQQQKPPEVHRMASVEERNHGGMSSAFTASRESLTGSIFGRLKRTFSITSDKRKSGMNPRWSASLQSLQQIDNVISYEDLSFINYDEFNQIEKQVDRALSQLDVKSSARNWRQQSTVDSAGTAPAPLQKYPEVVKRVKRRENIVSAKFQCDWDANFDKDKNLYRQSLDTDKLQTLSRLNRKSFRWSNVYEPVPTDYLQLETPESSKRVSFSNERMIYEDSMHLSEATSHSKSLPNLITQQEATAPQFMNKSRSLNNLDNIEPCSSSLKGKATADTSVLSDEPFFILIFNESDREFVGVKDGISLSVAIRESLAKRNLSISQVDINEDFFVTDASTLSSLKYCECIDKDINVRQLAGKTLVISARRPQKSRSTFFLRKASSVGSRRPGDLGASFDETFGGSKIQTKSKSLSNIWPSGIHLWQVKCVEQSGMLDTLYEFMICGIPNATSSYTCQYPMFEDALQYLGSPHNSWAEFVNRSVLSDVEQLLQSRLWEIVETEISYIFALQTVTDHFLACLSALNSKGFLTEVSRQKLFSNIWELCESNLTFWTTYIYPMVRHSIETQEPLKMDFLEVGFLQFGEIFHSYRTYCSKQSACHYYCKYLTRTNLFFAVYLLWCESHELCKRLKLADILVAPMQRLTRYILILNTIKQDEEKHGRLVENLDEMIDAVGDFVSSVDSSVSDVQGTERLRGVIARISGYDVVEKSGGTLECMAKQYSSMFDLSDPIEGCAVETTRHVFMEGDLRFKDCMGKFDVHCFLLTDILLVCKLNSKKTTCELKVCRTPYFTDRLKTMLRDETVYCIYVNEFGLTSTAFSLQCSEAKSWFEALEKARQQYTRLKHGFKSAATAAANDVKSNTPSLNNSRNNTPSVRNSPKSAGSSQSGSTELGEGGMCVSVDIERVSSISSDEGAQHGGSSGTKPKLLDLPKRVPPKLGSPILFEVKHNDGKGQSMPDLYSSFINHRSSNTLAVPGTSSGHGNLLSPSHRGISYPPPSPTRATLRRGLAFSFTNKNPPLVKTKNIASTSAASCDQASVTPIVDFHQISRGKDSSSRSPSPGTISHQQQQNQRRSPGKDSRKSSTRQKSSEMDELNESSA